MGAYSLAAGVGLLLGPWLGTHLLARAGSAPMWALGAAAALVPAPLLQPA